MGHYTRWAEPIPETTRVVNPAHRLLDAAVRKHNGLLSRCRAAFAALTLDQPLAPKAVQRWEQKKAALYEEIVQLGQAMVALKAQRKATERHIAIKDLPAEHRFSQLHCASKHFIDTIKMIASAGNSLHLKAAPIVTVKLQRVRVVVPSCSPGAGTAPPQKLPARCGTICPSCLTGKRYPAWIRVRWRS